MKKHFKDIILEATGAKSLEVNEVIQRLWSGYGEILRLNLTGAARESVVVKYVKMPGQRDHPRGWNTNLSHERKVKSYQVETAWYDEWSDRCGDPCRVPQCLAMANEGDEVLIVLEDLDAAGFSERRTSAGEAELQAGLSWLAHFHATFMGASPDGLWPSGTYWHLETRPDELDALDDQPLRAAAAEIARTLKDTRFQTFVHGDAKLANFCFAADGSVAAVDFQYVGGGCGMKDVAYFVGSCLRDEECERWESDLLDTYFRCLKEAVGEEGEAIETEWRPLYAVAWTDFHRFLKGWSPGHWKIHDYSEKLAREVVAQFGTDFSAA